MTEATKEGWLLREEALNTERWRIRCAWHARKQSTPSCFVPERGCLCPLLVPATTSLVSLCRIDSSTDATDGVARLSEYQEHISLWWVKVVVVVSTACAGGVEDPDDCMAH